MCFHSGGRLKAAELKATVAELRAAHAEETLGKLLLNERGDHGENDGTGLVT